MAESIVGWFSAREKYCSLADKPWIISQIRPSEQAIGIWHFITFQSSQINLSQIHRVGDGNRLYRSLCYNSILQLIAHSSTHFPKIKIQHISMSLVCLNNKYTNIFYIQLY